VNGKQNANYSYVDPTLSICPPDTKKWALFAILDGCALYMCTCVLVHVCVYETHYIETYYSALSTAFTQAHLVPHCTDEAQSAVCSCNFGTYMYIYFWVSYNVNLNFVGVTLSTMTCVIMRRFVCVTVTLLPTVESSLWRYPRIHTALLEWVRPL
jgi:hypothetical protein